ncbi:MAG TPA: hypothetical protein VFV42_11295 [Acidimicrobiales bacterium]|nr:hypothetical protein [Acidimicrobiales bacterium]
MPRTAHPVAALAVAALLLGACAPDDPPAAAAPAPEVDPPRAAARAAAADGAIETTLSIPVGTAGDGTLLEVVVRSVEAGERRLVAIDTADGRIDQHVVTPREHWWWIVPAAREAVGGIEWIHVDVAQVEAAGEPLPDVVADARVPLPGPGELEVGTRVAGYEVVAVERVGEDEDLVTLAGLDEPARLRRRSLPASTRIDLPDDAVELTDLPDLLPHLAPR